MTRTLTVGSLFAGIGGLDLGVALALSREGMRVETVWQVEWNPYCRAVLARHFPRAAQHGDITGLDAAMLAGVDGVIAGFPCQPASLAGKRKAQDDDRWLWPDVARLLGDLRPRFVFLENVAGLLSAGTHRGGALGEVLGDLARLRYDAWWACVRAEEAGAPHRRERWFCLAVADVLRDGLEGQLAAGAAPRATLGGGELADAGRFAGNWRANGDSGGGPDGKQRDLFAAGELIPQRGDDAPRRLADRGGRDGSGDGCIAGARVDGGRCPGCERCDGRIAQPGVGGGADGAPAGLDRTPARDDVEEGALLATLAAHRWPAGRGEPQAPWEAPRVAAAVDRRRDRLSALGNAVVPQQAALALAYLVAEARRDGVEPFAPTSHASCQSPRLARDGTEGVSLADRDGLPPRDDRSRVSSEPDHA